MSIAKKYGSISYHNNIQKKNFYLGGGATASFATVFQNFWDHDYSSLYLAPNNIIQNYFYLLIIFSFFRKINN